MIIRNRTTKTLEASPLNNRGCAVPPDRDKKGNIDPEGVALYAVRALFQIIIIKKEAKRDIMNTIEAAGQRTPQQRRNTDSSLSGSGPCDP